MTSTDKNIIIIKNNAQVALECAARIHAEKDGLLSGSYEVKSMAKDFLDWLETYE